MVFLLNFKCIFAEKTTGRLIISTTPVIFIYRLARRLANTSSTTGNHITPSLRQRSKTFQ